MKNRFIFKALLSSFLVLTLFLVAGVVYAAAPSVPSAPVLDVNDDTGVADNSTTQTTGLTISGSKDADSAIELYDFFGVSTTTIGTYPGTDGTAWDIDVDLAVGTHYLSAVATSTGGESATSTRLTIQITAQPTVDLLTAADFTILAKTEITDATPASTAITGNVGLSPAAGSFIAATGLSCTNVNGFIYVVNSTYTGGYDSNVSCRKSTDADKTTVDNAVADMLTAYNAAAGSPRGTGATYLNVGGGTLSGLTFTHGTYTWDSAVNITNDITLSGSATDKWIFQVNGTLGIAEGKKIVLSGGALASNIFWQVTGATTLITGATFEGTILDQTSIALQLGTVVHGRTLAQTAVTLIGSTVSSGAGDTSAPTITPITITSNNANPTLAKVGNVVTISFTSSKALAVATSTVNGFSATIATTSPTTFTATYTMTSGSSGGTVTFKIGTKDLAGNYSAEASAVTSGNNVVFDKAVPTITPITIISDNASTTLAKVGDVVTISFTSSEALAAATSTIGGYTGIVASTTATAFTVTHLLATGDTEGPIAFTISTRDLAGNYSVQAVAVTSGANVVFDKTAPVITISGTNPLSIGYRTTYTDAGASALDARDGSLTASMTTTNSVDVATAGAQTVTYSVSDTAGNSATGTRTVTVLNPDSGGVVSSGGGGSYAPYVYRQVQAVAAPVTTTVPTTAAEIMAQIQTILTQIRTLQASAGIPQTTLGYGVSGAAKLPGGLALGVRNGNVTALQKILAQDREVYPSGLVTGFFGSLTQKAVQAFQMKHGVVTSVNDAGYGYVGPKTRAKLIEIFGN